jgi:CubicO group peptidase (beta-lactamase class C family)
MMYGPSGLTDDDNRTALFSGDVVVPRTNNSWKAFGGGLEANPVDLARFGWLAGDGRITSAAFRDSTLMAAQPNSTNAYGWSMTNRDGRRIARHGGASTGAITELTVWPDHDLSIAIMSNQRGHSGLFGLAREMANIALSVSN